MLRTEQIWTQLRAKSAFIMVLLPGHNGTNIMMELRSAYLETGEALQWPLHKPLLMANCGYVDTAIDATSLMQLEQEYAILWLYQ